MVLDGQGAGLIAIGAGIAVGLTGVGAGMGEKDVGAAAVGAITEDPAIFGKAMIFMVIPETIVIFGLVIAIMAIFVVPGLVG
ncbi:MAG: ATPase [Candidatus Methanoplasma sp.]|nr:ATPase [Candidatus Methanoplasma sp.]